MREKPTAPSSPSPSMCGPVYSVKADFVGDGATGALIGILFVGFFKKVRFICPLYTFNDF